ncbi:MAG TPA: hypothetical protein VE175_09405 [Woeseiaceae bacterium]|jgi:hypothetical protein|nr:hypothetical protein [Woeseiaceae bacterium]
MVEGRDSLKRATLVMLPRDVTLEQGPRCGFDLGSLGEDRVKWLKDVID